MTKGPFPKRLTSWPVRGPYLNNHEQLFVLRDRSTVTHQHLRTTLKQ